MGLNIQCESKYLDEQKVRKMWQLIAREYERREDVVTVQCVSEEQIKVLNKRYRGKDRSTNVLTFSYSEDEHDISLCLAVAEREAEQRGIVLGEYVATLLAHAFLHVVGMDHGSTESEKEMRLVEMKFLSEAGFIKGYL
jgi:probable rRNA maturation factor